MLVLTRRLGERLMIGTGPSQIIVSIEQVWGNSVRVGVVAPRDVRILREEIVPFVDADADADDRAAGGREGGAA